MAPLDGEEQVLAVVVADKENWKQKKGYEKDLIENASYLL